MVWHVGRHPAGLHPKLANPKPWRRPALRGPPRAARAARRQLLAAGPPPGRGAAPAPELGRRRRQERDPLRPRQKVLAQRHASPRSDAPRPELPPCTRQVFTILRWFRLVAHTPSQRRRTDGAPRVTKRWRGSGGDAGEGVVVAFSRAGAELRQRCSKLSELPRGIPLYRCLLDFFFFFD